MVVIIGFLIAGLVVCLTASAVLSYGIISQLSEEDEGEFPLGE